MGPRGAPPGQRRRRGLGCDAVDEAGAAPASGVPRCGKVAAMRSCPVSTARVQLGWTIAFAAALCGCASRPAPTKRAQPSEVRPLARDADGPGADPPADL